MTAPKPRHVKRHLRFSVALQVILKVYPRAEELINGVEWSLARTPDRDGIHVGANVWQAHLVKSPVMPEARLYYTFDDRNVHMIDISLAIDN